MRRRPSPFFSPAAGLSHAEEFPDELATISNNELCNYSCSEVWAGLTIWGMVI
jgi:hypothetical protein